MTSNLTSKEFDAVIASKRIARRAALFRAAAGHSKWGIRTVHVLAAITMIYVAWTWSSPWALAAYMLVLCVLAVEGEISSRLDAVVKLLEQVEEDGGRVGA